MTVFLSYILFIYLFILHALLSLEACGPASIWTFSRASALSEWRLHHLGYQLVQLHQPMEPEGGLHHRAPQSQDVSSISIKSKPQDDKNVCWGVEFGVCCVIPLGFCENGVRLHEWRSNKDNITLFTAFAYRSPLNEDVFAAKAKEFVPVTHEEIKDLQAKIYKLFLQVNMSLLNKWIPESTHFKSFVAVMQQRCWYHAGISVITYKSWSCFSPVRKREKIKKWFILNGLEL